MREITNIADVFSKIVKHRLFMKGVEIMSDKVLVVDDEHEIAD